jgi:type I restriction enzyme S subunit
VNVPRIRLKHVATLNDDVLPETTDRDREMRYIDISSVDSSGSIHDGEIVTFADAPSRARRLVRDGDVIVSTVRTYLRAIAPISRPDSNMVVSTGFAVVRPRQGLLPRYAAYALQDPTFIEEVVANSEGVAYPGISPAKLATLRVAVPPLSAQAPIADYLDSETARIDTLIDRKQRFIDLLLEKRTALIAHAVTKGLDPDVEMKDSGYSFIGSVPSHWDVLPLKRVSAIRYGLAEPPAELADGLPMIRATNVFTGTISEVDMKYVDPREVPEGRNARLAAGEIVVVRSGACTGDSAIIPPTYDGAIAGFDMVVTAAGSDPDFLAWVLLSAPVVKAQIEPARTRAAQPHLNAEELGSCVVAVPPRLEQQDIARQIDLSISELDTLVDRTRQSIELLREYRAALISAAVTGQIDISGTETSEDVA